MQTFFHWFNSLSVFRALTFERRVLGTGCQLKDVHYKVILRKLRVEMAWFVFDILLFCCTYWAAQGIPLSIKFFFKDFFAGAIKLKLKIASPIRAIHFDW